MTDHNADAFYYDILGALTKSRQLEKRANEGDQQALRQKAAHDFDTLTLVKEAIDWAAMAPWKKGLIGGGAAAAPLVAGGAYLTHRANDTADRFRNNAIAAALGVGGVGAGLIALNHALKPKEAAAATPNDTAATLTKLATVGYIDAVLDEAEKQAAAETRADIQALRLLNAEHCTHLLQELLGA